MASAKKTRVEESDDESGSEIDKEELLHVDFETFPLCEADSYGIEQLLTKLFLKAKIDLKQFSKLLIKQHPLGCVYRPSLSDTFEDSEDDVYGVFSVVDLHQNETCMDSLMSFVQKKFHKNATGSTAKQFNSTYLSKPSDSTRKVGLIINERFANLPCQIALPSFQSLKKDMENMGKDFNFTHYMMILKIHKSEKKKKGNSEEGEVLFMNSEEEILSDECNVFFDYSVTAETEPGLYGTYKEEETTYQPFRRVIGFEAKIFDTFIEKLASQLS